MVFRGRLSKACQRCRERRLRCDYQRPSCSSCLRVSVPCTGYRDTVTIRITDETDDVRNKAIARSVVAQAQQISFLPPDIQTTGREIFFAHYVCDFSQIWAMLFKYHNSSDAPEHVTLSLDAVSLAFMAHNTASPSAADLGRRKYVSALRKINTELQHAESAKKASTFEGALLLDLYEKMTKSATAFNTGRNAHVEGALALVKLRGVEDFKDESEVKSMLGLSLNATVCSLAAGQRIPAQVRAIRAHVGQFVDITDPKWRLSDAMLEMADLTADVRANRLTKEEKITRCIELDSLLGDIAHEGHPEWRRKRIIIPYEYRAGTLPEGVPPIYDVYPNRTVAQSLNILRLNRILLCEDLLAPHTHANIEICSKATTTITAMIHEICASIPHMTDCSFAASSKLPPDAPCKHPTASQPTPHHTIAHVLDAYTLVFPLYILAWSRHCPPKIRTWALDHLTHIATHFGIRESGIVRDIVLNGHPGPQPEERRIEEIQPDEHQHENHPTNVSTLDTNASVKSGLGDQASLDTWRTRKREFNYVLLRHASDFYGMDV